MKLKRIYLITTLRIIEWLVILFCAAIAVVYLKYLDNIIERGELVLLVKGKIEEKEYTIRAFADTKSYCTICIITFPSGFNLVSRPMACDWAGHNKSTFAIFDIGLFDSKPTGIWIDCFQLGIGNIYDCHIQGVSKFAAIPVLFRGLDEKNIVSIQYVFKERPY